MTAYAKFNQFDCAGLLETDRQKMAGTRGGEREHRATVLAALVCFALSVCSTRLKPYIPLIVPSIGQRKTFIIFLSQATHQTRVAYTSAFTVTNRCFAVPLDKNKNEENNQEVMSARLLHPRGFFFLVFFLNPKLILSILTFFDFM